MNQLLELKIWTFSSRTYAQSEADKIPRLWIFYRHTFISFFINLWSHLLQRIAPNVLSIKCRYFTCGLVRVLTICTIFPFKTKGGGWFGHSSVQVRGRECRAMFLGQGLFPRIWSPNNLRCHCGKFRSFLEIMDEQCLATDFNQCDTDWLFQAASFLRMTPLLAITQKIVQERVMDMTPEEHSAASHPHLPLNDSDNKTV